ncbi:macro domain-containing protein [Microbacterium panaciterrae]|uniref:Protein-ADP-ribose hydrolase n=1 Tax=Microbacterium panaciterrae TaxID=985759 RepID=A0ABP8PJA4_9MICO
MTETVVGRLVDYFIDDVLPVGQATDIRSRRPKGSRNPDNRRLLAALLTSRAPGPLPVGILNDLDALLSGEREARGTVEADALPTLTDRGIALPGFPTDRVGMWRGDLTRLRADAIVNAANDRMLGCFIPGHACIDNAIHAAAGPRLREECDAHMRSQGTPEPTGHAVITCGYNLPAAHVIHTVGPIVRGELTDIDEGLLALSYQSILDAAHARSDIETVGLCSISTGVFGFPKTAAARVCLETIASWFDRHPDSALRIIISLFSDVDEVAYRTALSEMVPS